MIKSSILLRIKNTPVVYHILVACLIPFCRKPMVWTPRHDKLLIREILLYEPWMQRKGTPERGAVWKRIAESLNQIADPDFKVDDRSVRDHYKILEKKFKRKQSEEERASGIVPEEATEIDQGMNDIVTQFKDYDLIHQEDKSKKSEALSKEVNDAEEFRKSSLETFGETRKRTGLEDDPGCSKKRKSRSETQTLAYFKREVRK